MTKTEESHMLRDIKRTAAATERIARALEQLVNLAKADAEYCEGALDDADISSILDKLKED